MSAKRPELSHIKQRDAISQSLVWKIAGLAVIISLGDQMHFIDFPSPFTGEINSVTVYFSTDRAPYVKGSTLKGKNFLQKGANSLLLK